jgi:excisionase family DNA binding protein
MDTHKQPGGEVMETSAEVQPMWLSYRQCKSLTGLSRGTLAALVSSGKVEAAKVGTRVLIRKASLIHYLESQSYTESIRQ